MKKITANRFLLYFTLVCLFLGLVRIVFPSLAKDINAPKANTAQPSVEQASICSVPEGNTGKQGQKHSLGADATGQMEGCPTGCATGLNAKLFDKKKHRIFSVPSFKEAFPDSQAVQYASAQRYGIRAVKDREDAERRKRELVAIQFSPYYIVDPLRSSVPYLVPRAAVLLQDIGKAFFDSLYVKGVPLMRMRVTSVLRTKDDVERLRRHNGNATENSCHLMATTFDICYNRYGRITRQVSNDTMKWVLSEVLRDKRREGRCHVKYEVKQGCFHITVAK